MLNLNRLLNLFHNMGIWPWLSLTIALGFLIFFTAFGFLSMCVVNDSTRRILEEGQVLTQMAANEIDALLDGAFYELEKAKRPIDIEALTRKVVEKVQSITDRHSFLMQFEPLLPSVPGDYRRLEQVLHNLLDNAIKYSSQGSQITICGEVKNDHIQVSVADEGHGIPQAELFKLFDAFYRISGPDDLKVRTSDFCYHQDWNRLYASAS